MRRDPGYDRKGESITPRITRSSNESASAFGSTFEVVLATETGRASDRARFGIRRRAFERATMRQRYNYDKCCNRSAEKNDIGFLDHLHFSSPEPLSALWTPARCSLATESISGINSWVRWHTFAISELDGRNACVIIHVIRAASSACLTLSGVKIEHPERKQRIGISRFMISNLRLLEEISA